jgi:hypothetical protein
MSSLKLNGSTSGYVEIVPPAVAGNNSVTLPSGSGTLVTGDSGGNLNVSGIITATSFVIGAGSTASPSLSPTGDSNTGIFFPAADTIAFGEGGAESARFDSSGRFGLGTSLPLAPLHVASTTNTVTWGSPGSQSQLTASTIIGDIATNSGGSLAIRTGALGTVYATGFGIDGTNDGNAITTINLKAFGTQAGGYGSTLAFHTTNGTSLLERMRLRNDGRLLQIATGTDSHYTFTTQGAGTDNAFYAAHHSASGFSGTLSYIVYTNGNVRNTNGSYTSLSDAKLKENIVDANSQWNDIKAIRIRNWNFKEETGHGTHRQIGPIAQELEEVCPGLVFETPDRDEDENETGEVTKGVNQSILYMKAVKALQEAMERIETLEAEVAALKNS